MLQEGLIITIVGMSTVLVFLTILVFVVDIVAKIMVFVNKFMPEEVEVPVVAKKENNLEEEVAVAIAVAKMNV